MPRNVRNFFITVDVDGRPSNVRTGPQRADGGIAIRVQQRDAGEVTEVGYLVGRAKAGRLVLQWEGARAMDPIVLAETRRD